MMLYMKMVLVANILHVYVTEGGLFEKMKKFVSSKWNRDYILSHGYVKIEYVVLIVDKVTSITFSVTQSILTVYWHVTLKIVIVNKIMIMIFSKWANKSIKVYVWIWSKVWVWCCYKDLLSTRVSGSFASITNLHKTHLSISNLHLTTDNISCC